MQPFWQAARRKACFRYRLAQAHNPPYLTHVSSVVHLIEPLPETGSVVRLIADSPIASVISDPRLPDNPIIACNAKFCALTQYRPDQILGRNCRFLSGPGTEPWLSEAITAGVRDHRPVLVEILNYKADGTPFRNAVLVAPIYDDADELLYFLGSQVEISDDGPGPSTTRRILAAEKVKRLSERQRQVLKLAADGLLNKQIAGVLTLSEKTVKMHRSILMERLGANTMAEMIRIAVEAGL
jgi:DNA-binding NarL/FixJ family response regulator